MSTLAESQIYLAITNTLWLQLKGLQFLGFSVSSPQCIMPQVSCTLNTPPCICLCCAINSKKTSGLEPEFVSELLGLLKDIQPRDR